MLCKIWDFQQPLKSNWEFTPAVCQKMLEELRLLPGPAIFQNADCYGTLGDLLPHEDSLTVPLEKLSHVFRNLHVNDHLLVGEIEILSELPCGKILEELMKMNPSMIRFKMRGASAHNAHGELARFHLASIAAVYAR